MKKQANGLRYLRVGGRGQGLGAGKTRNQKNARKWRRIFVGRFLQSALIVFLRIHQLVYKFRSEILTVVAYTLYR